MSLKQRLFVYGLLSTVILILTQSAFAQAGNSINGMVFDTSRNPISDLRIELQDENGIRVTSIQTNGSGQFYFRGLANGMYVIKPITIGTKFVSQSVSVRLLSVSVRGSGSHSEQIDLVLKTEAEIKGKVAINNNTIFAQEVPEAAKSAFNKGVKILADGGNSEGGLLALKDAVDIFPDFFAALEKLGTELIKINQFDSAIIVLQKATTVNPKSGNSFYALGVAEYRLKQFKNSIDSLKKSISVSPTSPNVSMANYYLGLALLKDGNSKEAVSSLKRAYETGEKIVPSDVHMALAQIYSSDKQYKDAIKELELYLKENPDADDKLRINGLIQQMQAKMK